MSAVDALVTSVIEVVHHNLGDARRKDATSHGRKGNLTLAPKRTPRRIGRTVMKDCELRLRKITTKDSAFCNTSFPPGVRTHPSKDSMWSATICQRTQVPLQQHVASVASLQVHKERYMSMQEAGEVCRALLADERPPPQLNNQLRCTSLVFG
ncbi:hypothetical protein LTS10_009404 [Elasticomyces elasticus]|nr:hypothetical protein LTS10_009404 [Elasticomyces elasticus]